MSLKDFQIISKLGEGTYSSVWRAKRISDGQEYAIKKVKLSSLSEKERLNSLNEVRLLASIESPFIIGFKEVFFEEAQTLCVVMEFAGAGDIYNLILQHQRNRTYFKEKDIWRYSLQMILGLKVLHDRKILHRDLKCANIFLSKDQKTAKLGDLNVSKVAKERLVYTQTGTPYYASPEVWRDEPYDAKSDIWSLGCVIYEICALKPPFRGRDMSELFKKVQKGAFERIPSCYSNDLNTLISLCLQVVPAKRPYCNQLLEHPIVRKNCEGFLDNFEEDDCSMDLLRTIRMPKNLKNLKAFDLNLPKPNYKKQIKSMSFNNNNLTQIPDTKTRNFLEQYHTITNLTEPDQEESKPNSRMSPERSLVESFDMETYQVRPKKRDADPSKKSRPAEVAKMHIKRVLGGPKASDINVRARRVRDVVDGSTKEGKSMELVRPGRANVSQELVQEVKQRTKTIEDDGEAKRLYLVKRHQSRERNPAIIEVNYGKVGYHNVNVSNVSNGGKNTSSLNLDKGNLSKMYEDRIDAIERRAKQLIQKYQYDVEILRKSEEPSKRGSPDLRNKRDSRGMLEKQRPNYDVLKANMLDPYRDNTPSPKIKVDYLQEMKRLDSRRHEEKRGMDESIEMDFLKNFVDDRPQVRGQNKPVWWG